MINYIEYLNIPVRVAIIVVAIFFILQVIGELLEFKGKVVPEYIKIRKYFTRKKQEKAESTQTLKEVKQLALLLLKSDLSQTTLGKQNLSKYASPNLAV